MTTAKAKFPQQFTEFSKWLREQPQLDSYKGYVATNLDYFWGIRGGPWMLLEEKRFKAEMKPFQFRIFRLLDKLAQEDENYRGFHFLQFEQTNPEDGKIYLDGIEITKTQLVEFLEFKAPEAVYKNTFLKT